MVSNRKRNQGHPSDPNPAFLPFSPSFLSMETVELLALVYVVIQAINFFLRSEK